MFYTSVVLMGEYKEMEKVTRGFSVFAPHFFRSLFGKRLMKNAHPGSRMEVLAKGRTCSLHFCIRGDVVAIVVLLGMEQTEASYNSDVVVFGRNTMKVYTG
jgi:hypothetical protein